MVASLAAFYNVEYRPWSDNELPPWFIWFGIQIAVVGWMTQLLRQKRWLCRGAIVISLLLLWTLWPARMKVHLFEKNPDSVYGLPYRIDYEPITRWQWRNIYPNGLSPGSSAFSGTKFEFARVRGATLDEMDNVSIRDYSCEALRVVYWGPISVMYARGFSDNQEDFNLKECTVIEPDTEG
ncbi:hypothetical protein [Serratia sp. X10]|uniref:hypothetical protein n=1 Tax=Serratia TaxID=613 RepID=UPI0015F68BFE|nr:hypothetical protein [Serratia sp. X10]MCH6191219.1 hypothetical protein [Serratia sp. X10]